MIPCEKCIQISTNMSSIGLVIAEIDFDILRRQQTFKLHPYFG